MTLGGLFSGIGGFELAAQWAGITPVWSNEINPFCCKVLRKNFFHEIIEADIRTIGRKRKHELSPVDIICGGFPCQPFSGAGKRKGNNDDRYLWPEMLRVIDEIKPTWVIGENVAGITSMDIETNLFKMEDEENYFLWVEKVLQRIITDLNSIGYDVPRTRQGEPIFFNIPACAVGAPHQRERIWIIAYPDSKLQDAIIPAISKVKNNNGLPSKRSEDWSKFELVSGIGLTGVGFYNGHDIEPTVIRGNDGLSERLDQNHALGNAIVPQIAQVIFESILQIV